MSDRRADEPADDAVWIGGSLLSRPDIERMLRAFVGLVAIAASLAGIAGLYGHDPKAYAAAGAALVVALVLHLLVRAGRFGLGAAIWTWMLVAIGVFVTLTGNGIRDVGMNIFSVAIISAGLLLPRRAALVTMVAVVVTAGMIGVAEVAGWLRHPYAHLTRPDQVADIVILLGAVAALVVLLSRTFYQSLRKTFATERSYAQIFNATHDAILVAEPETHAIVNVNQAAARMFNRASASFAGSNLAALLGERDENGLEIAEHVRAAVSAGERRFEVSLTGADGTRLELEVSLQKATVGDRVNILTVVRDIGERRAMEKTLREGEKLRVVGQLARGVAHDFNNQLTGILGSATLLDAQLSGSPAAQGHLDVIERSARRSAELVSQLLAFARAGTQRRDAVDCNHLVDEVEQLLRRSLDKRIDIRVRKASEHVTTFGDATLLQNALLNLALNARDAMPDGGELLLSALPIAVDDGTRRGLPVDLPNGRYASLVVADTGTGIDAGTLARIFEPFFTTKKTGNGMGLAAVYGTVRSHGGATRVDSEPGRGTRFELLLPLADALPALDVAPARAGARASNLTGLHILLGDDEPLVRETTRLLLEHVGCVVDSVASGVDALRKHQLDPQRYDLIILDHDMPGLSGTDTARRLRQSGVKVPILIISGYGEEVVTDEGEVIQGLLPKPFSEDELTAAVSAVLDGRRPRTAN